MTKSKKPITHEWERYRSWGAYRRALENERKSELPWFSFNVYDALESCRKKVPGIPEHPVALFFSPSRTLANIDTRPDSCRILMHSLLNRADVPREVIEYILLHELVHLVVPPREIEGKLKSHPQEFWELANGISGQGDIVWGWIWLATMGISKGDEEHECIFIKPSWKRGTAGRYPTLDNVREWFSLGNKPEESVTELI